MAMFGDPEEFAIMSDREKYLYDLQGFLVVRNLLSTEEVQALNDAPRRQPGQDQRTRARRSAGRYPAGGTEIAIHPL